MMVDQDDTHQSTSSDLADMDVRNIGYLLRDSHRSFRRIMKARIAEHGITVAMWTQLWELWQRDGLTQSELARLVNVEKPSANATLTKMEAMGLVERRSTLTDRREKRVFLRERARSMRSDLTAMASRINEDVLAGFTEREAATLLRLMRKLHATARHLSRELP